MKRSYDKQFKIATVKLVLEDDMSISNVAKELSIHCNPQYRWISEYEEYGDSIVVDAFIQAYITIKIELILDVKYETPEQAQKEIFKYIELYYNIKRIYSSLHYLHLMNFKN